ncbi:G2/mitotic-specific cyclin-B [Tritrichomonas foetus]|uniref:G2/mitotic-specific cyclin-B n=1 Tax=Tritrichomonas foetus TaxID=1144522 RepID=A0A1J4JZK1_9EUKA|nr:G2/mitotic-specific cyclin-B [Tritrichomonas foetus]|eukprot:OHT02685.1 G2/mitotic-specific cyclin-B [Tritrichomonas foetus]
MLENRTSSSIAIRGNQTQHSQPVSRKALHDASSRINGAHEFSKTNVMKTIPENMKEIEEPNQILKPSRLGEIDDPQDAYDFDLEVYQTMKREERVDLPNPDYFEQQTSITPKMRTIVFDWLVDVHGKLGFHTDTLYLTMNIIDRYLSIISLDKTQFQKFACAATLIAAKNLELYTPSLRDLVQLADRSFTTTQLAEAEAEMMSALDFRINPFLPSMFLKRYLRIMQPDFHLSMVSHYILETTILDQKFIGETPSKLAAAAVCLAATLYRGTGQWTEEAISNTGFTIDDLTDLIQKLLNCVNTTVASRYTAIRRKYSGKEMDNVSGIRYPELMNAF